MSQSRHRPHSVPASVSGSSANRRAPSADPPSRCPELSTWSAQASSVTTHTRHRAHRSNTRSLTRAPRFLPGARARPVEEAAPDKAQVHAEAAVHARAGQADIHAVRHGRPGWILRRAVKADLGPSTPVRGKRSGSWALEGARWRQTCSGQPGSREWPADAAGSAKANWPAA